jgi:hypothetical protein
MSPSSIAPFVSSLVFGTLGVLVLTSNPRSRVHWAYFLWAALTVWWQGTWTVLFNVTDPHFADFLVRFGYSGIVFLPVAYYTFVVEFVGLAKEKRNLTVFLYAVSAVTLCLLWTTDLFIKGYYHYSWGYYPKAGPIHPLYLLWTTYAILQCTWLPYRESLRAKDSPIRLNQLRSIVWATASYSLAAVDFACNYGLNIYPWGVFCIHVSAFIISFSMNKYRLLDINLLFRSAAVYTAGAAVVTVALAWPVWALKSPALNTFFIFLAAVVGGAMFGRFRDLISQAVDLLPPFKGRYSRFRDLQKFVTEVGGTRSVQDWGWKTIAAVKNMFRPDKAAVLVFDDTEKCFKLSAGWGYAPEEWTRVRLEPTAPLVLTLARAKLPLIKETLGSDGEDPEDARQVAADMKFIGAEVCGSVFHRGRLSAVLCVGRTANNSIHNDVGASTFTGLLRAVEEIYRGLRTGIEQKYATSAWAHDLQLAFSQRGPLKNFALALRGQFGPVPKHLVPFLEAALRAANFVSDHLYNVTKPLLATIESVYEVSPVPLTKAFEWIAFNYAPAAKDSKINLKVSPPPESLLVLCDPHIIEQRVLVNLIENAFRYTPAKGTIEVGYEIKNGSFVGHVRDNGLGIRPDDLHRIFQRGEQIDEVNKGTAGLGLFSVKTTVEAHHGRVWVDSEWEHGSSFFFELPLKTK